METRKTTTVATTQYTGYPSYSRLDNRIAFSTVDGADTVVSFVKVKVDKQTPDGSPTIAVRKMKWAVFFADGNRILSPVPARQPAVQRPATSRNLDAIIIQTKGIVKMLIVGAGIAPVRIGIARADGRIMHREILLPKATGESLPYSWNGNSAGGMIGGHGIYFIRIETSQGIVSKKFFFN
jgi:hypothetical protein